jgi:hypothetical protein
MSSKLTRAIRCTAAAAVASLAAATFVAGPAHADPETAPPSDRITIDVVTINGSGCPAGTADVEVSPDNTSFHVTYHNYVAWVGAGAKPTDFRKNCQLALQIHVPQGFTYAIAQAEYNGFAHLVRGATGLQRANYYFQGSSQTSSVSHPFSAPYSDYWQTTDTTDSASLVWAPCGIYRNLNVNSELRVRPGPGDSWSTSFMTMDTSDGSIRTIFHFAWKRCE